MKSYKYHFLGQDYNLGFFFDRYTFNGNLYVGLINLDDDDDPWFADLTVNIIILLPYAAVIYDQYDPQITEWLESIGAGTAYGHKLWYNNCEYPVFQFNPEFMQYANPESYEKLFHADAKS